MTNLDRLLSIAEVCETIGVSRAKVYKLFDSGLQTVKLGGSTRIRESELRRFIDSLESGR